MSELEVRELALPLALAAGSSLVLWGLLSLVLRNYLKAALLSSFFWVWFFSYAHLQALLTSSRSVRLGFAGAWPFLPFYAAVLIAGVVLLIMQKRGTAALTSTLNFVAIVLIAWYAVSIGTYEFKRQAALRKTAQAEQIVQAGPSEGKVKPNIYFIILDGYAREDVLREFYDSDNRDFIHYLQEKGFHVARGSKANYCQTALSVSSTLNLDYLQTLLPDIHADSDDRQPLNRMIRNSRLLDFLKQQGYTTVAFPSGFSATEIQEVDLYLYKGRISRLSEFQECIILTTPIVLFLRQPISFRPLPPSAPPQARRETKQAQRILFVMEHIAETSELEPPVFVFAHIVCPHPPFVFDRNGPIPSPEIPLNALADGSDFPGSRQEYVEGYREQLIFLNPRMKVVIDEILSRARRPTVIILQADHGPGSMLNWESAEKTNMKERLATLTAYYLPGEPPPPAIDDISPVNMFRIVLNRYFDAHLEILPNESYFSTWSHPYRFLRVTDEVGSAAPADQFSATQEPR
jgi:hypothetical protein